MTDAEPPAEPTPPKDDANAQPPESEPPPAVTEQAESAAAATSEQADSDQAPPSPEPAPSATAAGQPPAEDPTDGAEPATPELPPLPLLAAGAAGAVVLALVGGLAIGRWSAPAAPPPADAAPEAPADAAPSLWTCSMHPQIQSPDPGLCPICGMDLIPVSAGGSGGPRVLELSPLAAQLAEVQTAEVSRREVEHEIRLVGKVAFDETRLRYITAWVPGRLDRLYVDYTGTLVRAGDHLVDLYSPELLSAQEELLQALDARAKLDGASALLRQTAERTLASSREKLRLWGLGADQIGAIEATGTVSEHITIRAPAGGVVVHKNKNAGDYVKTGERVYTIADLSQVWVLLDAYESDLPWIHYGQRVSFETEAYPGERFEGQVVLVDPVLDERTRTIKLRLNVANPDRRLKPGLFVRAVARTPLSRTGHALDPALAGMWVCPMHGEVLKEEQAPCDLCGMHLVPVESLHEVGGHPERLPLVVPASAVLWTGVRSVVYVRLPGEAPVFEGREVVLGPRSGDHYVVEGGLVAGERVVTRGAFKIDSALQIQARPSMMLPEDRPPPRLPVSAQALAALEPVYASYGRVQRALAGDDLPAARASAEELAAACSAVDLALFTQRPSKREWVGIAAHTRRAAKALAAAPDVAAAREAFLGASTQVLRLAQRLGHAGPSPRHEAYCPMAFDDEGASWLQDEEQIANPYFGASMLRCGEVRETFEPGGGQ